MPGLVWREGLFYLWSTFNAWLLLTIDRYVLLGSHSVFSVNRKQLQVQLSSSGLPSLANSHTRTTRKWGNVWGILLKEPWMYSELSSNDQDLARKRPLKWILWTCLFNHHLRGLCNDPASGLQSLTKSHTKAHVVISEVFAIEGMAFRFSDRKVPNKAEKEHWFCLIINNKVGQALSSKITISSSGTFSTLGLPCFCLGRNSAAHCTEPMIGWLKPLNGLPTRGKQGHGLKLNGPCCSLILRPRI